MHTREEVPVPSERGSERYRAGEGPAGSKAPQSDLGSEPGRREMQGWWWGGEAPALRPSPHPTGLTAHHSEHTGTHSQGTKSPACPYMLAQRTWTPEHVQKRCQHLREEKEARGHSQATAPTPAQRHLPVSPTRQPSVASGRCQALWMDRAASALTTPPGTWNPPALSHCALCRVAHSPAPGHGMCRGVPGGSNLGTDTTHHTHTRKSWHFLLMVGD